MYWRKNFLNVPTIIVFQLVLSTNCGKFLLKSEFSSQFIRDNFMECTLVIFQDDTSFSRIFTNDLQLLLRKDIFLLSSHSVSSSQNNSSKTVTNKITDVHKFRDKCVITVIALHLISDIILSDMLKRLKSFEGITKKDKDRFIFATKEEHIESIMTSKHLGMKIKYRVAIAENLGNQSVTIKTTCFYCNFGNPLLLDLVSSESDPLKIPTATELYKDYVRNFYGKVLQVSTPTGTKWLNEIVEKKGKWLAKRGVYKLTMDAIMEHYNFSCEFFPSAGGGGTGLQMKNGTWIGTVSDIIYDRADIGHVTGQTFSRNKLVGHSFPVSYTWLTFTTGRPKAYFSWKAIYWPLKVTVWLLIILSSFVSLFVFKLIIKIFFAKFKTNWNFFKIFWSLLGTFLEQGVNLPSVTSSSTIRAFAAFWLIFCMVMTTAYRSKLISFLAFPNVEHLPETFEELADSHMKFGLQYLRGAAYALLKTSTNPTYIKIFNQMELEEDEAKCFQRTFNSKFSCIAWDDIADYVYHKNLSDRTGRVPMVKAPATTCFLSVGIIMEQRAIFQTNFNFVIISAVDFGLMKRWREMDYEFIRAERKSWEQASNTTKVNYDEYYNSNTGALTLNHLVGSYYLLCVGSVIAFLCFSYEYLSHLIKKRKLTDSNQADNQDIVFILDDIKYSSYY